jgi:TnpA family transposase
MYSANFLLAYSSKLMQAFSCKHSIFILEYLLANDFQLKIRKKLETILGAE